MDDSCNSPTPGMETPPVFDIVYVLSNPAFKDGIVKIGHTAVTKPALALDEASLVEAAKKQVSSRMSELFNTGVPLPFKCEYAAILPQNEFPSTGRQNDNFLEKTLHDIFGESRLSPPSGRGCREFFWADVTVVKKILTINPRLIEVPWESFGLTDSIPKDERESMTEQSMVALASAISRCQPKPKLNLAKLGFSTGDVLVFARDQAVTALVVSPEKNLLNVGGETLPPTPAARKAYKAFNGSDYSGSGSLAWMFNGETLDERRKRMEKEGTYDNDEVV